MSRKPETWGETFRRYAAKGHDYSSAAYAADENEKRQHHAATASPAPRPTGLKTPKNPPQPKDS